jgi:hypothetical protein
MPVDRPEAPGSRVAVRFSMRPARHTLTYHRVLLACRPFTWFATLTEERIHLVMLTNLRKCRAAGGVILRFAHGGTRRQRA